MPRSGAGKRNQHNHRHENGLVGPGKRISKQRSNGQLNGAAKGAGPDTPPLTPASSAEPLMKNHVANESNASLSDSKHDTVRGPGSHPVRKRNSESSTEGHNGYHNGVLPGKEPERGFVRRHDVTTTRTTYPADVGTLQLASTILKSCPAYDTIAMLILLLQLPPTFLTLIQALFASLTFMPPSGLSMTSVFTLFDVFQGSAGTPSLGTMIAVDALCLGGWFCLWNWARNFALDLAQVQIAITLGGGNAGKAGSINSVCVAIVLLLHLVRSRPVRQFVLGHVLSAKLPFNEHLAYMARHLPRESEFGSTPQSPSWYQSLFAIHIITQAGIAIIRRNVAGSQANHTAKPSQRADTEASAGVQSSGDISPFESSSNITALGVAEAQAPLCPTFKDSKERATSTKKRRRQATQVRSRQPFWAALASTKVNALREIEISRPSPRSTGHTLPDISDMASPEDEQIRIIHVDSSSIKFEATNLSAQVDDQEAVLSSPQKPLFVRINGAYWTSSCISPSRTDVTGKIWSGEISGLAPNCTYTCSFFRDNDQEIAIIMVKTPALSDKDQLPSLSVPSFRHSQRPSSPTTTLRQSIATAEAKLTDIKARGSRARRSHKAAISKLEKEVDSFNGRLKSSNDDTKQRQKLLQAERTMKQNEDATHLISAALDDLSTIPEEEADHYSATKDAFEKQCALLAVANEALASAKSAADSEVVTLNEELKAINRQRERLLARQSRLNEQHDRITQANLQGLNEKERKAEEMIAKERDHTRIEAEYLSQFSIFRRELKSLSVRSQQAKQEAQAIESQLMLQQQQNSMIGGGPSTPEGKLPGMSLMSRPAPSAFGSGFACSHAMTTLPFPTSPEPAHASSILPYGNTLPIQNEFAIDRGKNRARSASGRSGVAGGIYSADFEDADPIPPMPGRTILGPEVRRKGSGGSPAAGGRGSPTDSISVGAGGLGAVGAPLRASTNPNMPQRGNPRQGSW